MQFIKAYSGENDFIIIDNRKEKLPEKLGQFILRLANRHKGIGADGIIIIEKSKTADFKLRYFNPDATEYSVCGNGSLCVMLYENKPKIKFNTNAGLFKGGNKDNKSFVQLPKPKNIILDFYLTVGDKKEELNFVDVGVPHTISFVEDVKDIDINKLGKPIRFHTYFSESGTNVNFVQIVKRNEIIVRTYERGIEGETDCGSGSCSACIVGWMKKKLDSNVKVTTRGGVLEVEIKKINDITLYGNPKIVYKGNFTDY
jgi:diaminopimelate epimerase